MANYEMFDKVKVKKTGYKGKIMGVQELFGKRKYTVQQDNGKNTWLLTEEEIERA